MNTHSLERQGSWAELCEMKIALSLSCSISTYPFTILFGAGISLCASLALSFIGYSIGKQGAPSNMRTNRNVFPLLQPYTFQPCRLQWGLQHQHSPMKNDLVLWWLARAFPPRATELSKVHGTWKGNSAEATSFLFNGEKDWWPLFICDATTTYSPITVVTISPDCSHNDWLIPLFHTYMPKAWHKHNTKSQECIHVILHVSSASFQACFYIYSTATHAIFTRWWAQLC